MKFEIVRDFPDPIIFNNAEPCVSLYQLIHRHSTEKKKDSIVFKNLVQEIENSLKQKYDKYEINSIMKPFIELRDDMTFWENTSADGLAILANPDRCIIYFLSRPVQDLTIVSNSFHVTPLIRAFQSADNYQLLGLNSRDFSIYEGNRYELKRIDIPPEIKTNIKDVLGDQYTESRINSRSFGGPRGANTPPGTGTSSAFHGSGEKSDEIGKDIERFFRYVDKTVMDNYSKKSQLPLILVALAEHEGEFRKISNNPYLLEKAIKSHLDSFSMDDLKTSSWYIVLDSYLEKTKILAETFNLAKAKDLGSDELTRVGEAAFEKRIKTLIVEADRIIPGKYDASSGHIELEDLETTHYGSVLDGIIKSVLKENIEVVVIPKERMPSDAGVAAIYRF